MYIYEGQVDCLNYGSIQYVFSNVETKLTFQTTSITPGRNRVMVGLEPLAPSALSGALPVVTKCMKLCLSDKISLVQRFSICGAES